MPENKKSKKRAAAIKYDPNSDNVPILSAFGEGYVAEKIIEKGKQAGVPVVADSGLASILAKMSVGDEIPPSIYEVVAKVLVFVSDMDSKYGERMKQATKNIDR